MGATFGKLPGAEAQSILVSAGILSRNHAEKESTMTGTSTSKNLTDDAVSKYAAKLEESKQGASPPGKITGALFARPTTGQLVGPDGGLMTYTSADDKTPRGVLLPSSEVPAGEDPPAAKPGPPSYPAGKNVRFVFRTHKPESTEKLGLAPLPGAPKLQLRTMYLRTTSDLTDASSWGLELR